MTASLDEVVALLGKWKNEGSGIHLIFSGARSQTTGAASPVWFSGFATVIEVSALAVRLTIGPRSVFTVAFLNTCNFEYADPREAPESVREASGVVYECSLVIRPPSGEHIQLMQIKS